MSSSLSSFFRILLASTGVLLLSLPAQAQRNVGETTADAAVPENDAMAEIKDVPGLPRVLLIGDSISIAYTIPVRKLLQGKANVHRIPVNASSSNAPDRVKTWTAVGKWDVIHFNFGVHDAKIINEKPQVSLEEYEKNLRIIIKNLKATGAKLVWATTTPIPAELKPPGRKFTDIKQYNEVALRVMKETGVSIDDLYQTILPHQTEFQHPFDVHFTPEGSQLLAKSVATSIEAQLHTP